MTLNMMPKGDNSDYNLYTFQVEIDVSSSRRAFRVMVLNLSQL